MSDLDVKLDQSRNNSNQIFQQKELNVAEHLVKYVFIILEAVKIH
jgi:hypothetical protein